MAFVEGWRGAVSVAANKLANITHWTATFGAGKEETGSFGSDHKERTYTIKDVSGNFEGYFDKSDTNQTALVSQFCNGGTPAAVWLYLYVSGSEGYYGQALIDVTLDAEVAGLQKINVSFEEADEFYVNLT